MWGEGGSGWRYCISRFGNAVYCSTALSLHLRKQEAHDTGEGGKPKCSVIHVTIIPPQRTKVPALYSSSFNIVSSRMLKETSKTRVDINFILVINLLPTVPIFFFFGGEGSKTWYVQPLPEILNQLPLLRDHINKLLLKTSSTITLSHWQNAIQRSTNS